MTRGGIFGSRRTANPRAQAAPLLYRMRSIMAAARNFHPAGAADAGVRQTPALARVAARRARALVHGVQATKRLSASIARTLPISSALMEH